MGVTPDDQITVIVTASPRPADPDISMIQETIAAFRSYLPTSHVWICFDGVRAEQEHRTGPYKNLIRRVEQWAAAGGDPMLSEVVFHQHQHQTGMVSSMLPRIATPFVLFVEQDAPLVGDINFVDILEDMQRDHLSVMRFLHEIEVFDSADYLYLERRPTDGRRYVRTVQYSSRPQVVRTSVMRRWAQMWGPNTRSMIEDFLYGICQHGLKDPPDREALRQVWIRDRMAIWAPHESLKHSTHLDGRGEDPKYPIFVDAPGDPIPGAPANGVHEL